MQSILFAILIVISVNIQPAEAQSKEQEREKSLEELDKAIEKAHDAMSNLERVIKESEKEELSTATQKLRKQLEELRNKQRKQIDLFEKNIRSFKTVGIISYPTKRFYSISETIGERIRQFKEFKSAEKNQERENSLNELDETIKKIQGVISNADRMIEESKKKKLSEVAQKLTEHLKGLRIIQDRQINALGIDLEELRGGGGEELINRIIDRVDNIESISEKIVELLEKFERTSGNQGKLEQVASLGSVCSRAFRK